MFETIVLAGLLLLVMGLIFWAGLAVGRGNDRARRRRRHPTVRAARHALLLPAGDSRHWRN